MVRKPMENKADDVVFEQPLTERIRSFLRLEFLFAEYDNRSKDTSAWGVRAALHTLLDIISVIGRSDLRTDLAKDFTEQTAHLSRLKARPEVNHARLENLLSDLRGAIASLQKAGGVHPSQLLRENEFLFAILNRSAVPGGTCAFDLPAYHRWLSRPHEEVTRDLDAWFKPLRVFGQSIGLYLRLLRESADATEHVANGGVYLHQPLLSYSMVRVVIPASADVYPEISAGKHRISIRFMRLGDINSRNFQAVGEIPFHLQCCVLSGPA